MSKSLNRLVRFPQHFRIGTAKITGSYLSTNRPEVDGIKAFRPRGWHLRRMAFMSGMVWLVRPFRRIESWIRTGIKANVVEKIAVLWDDSIQLQEKVRSAYYAADIGLGSTVWFRFPFRVKPRHKKTSRGTALALG